MHSRTIRAALAVAAAWSVVAAASAAAQKGPRKAPPNGAEIAQMAKGKKLDEGNRLVAAFQGQPIAYTPAAENASITSLDDLRGGRFLGVLETKAVGDESGLPPGTYNVFVAEVDGKWRAFAEANGEIVKEAARVRIVRSDRENRKPGFGEKGWFISDPVCCVDSDPTLGYANTVALTPTPVSVAAGRSAQLSPTVYDVYGKSVSGATVTWTSSNPAVAPVSATGTVQGMTAGTVTITATSGSKSGTATVNVTPPVVASVQLGAIPTSVKLGEYVTVTATPLDDQSKAIAGQNVTWTVSGPAQWGYTSATSIRLVGTGPGTVTATATGGTVNRSASITVNGGSCACTVVIYPETLSPVLVGGTTGVGAYAKATDGSYLPLGHLITFSKRDSPLREAGTTHDATYASARYEGTAPGRVMINAFLADKYSSFAQGTVTGPVARLDLAPSVTSVEVGKTMQMKATTYDAAGTQVPPGATTWTSSNPSVFVVSSTGVITGGSPGAASLSATANGVTGYAAVSVTPVPVASVSVTPPSTQMGTYASLALVATPRDAAGNALTGRDVRWTSTSNAVAAVDQAGIVTSGTAGTATITATSEGKSGTATVTVAAPSTPPAGTTAVAVEVYW